MKHLRLDWQGIVDTRQWLLPELRALLDEVLGGDPDAQGAGIESLRRILHRLVAEAGLDDADIAGYLEPVGSTILVDEPVWLGRAKDASSIAMVRFWAAHALAHGADGAYAQRVLHWADEMEAYAKAKRADGTWGPPHAPDAPELRP
jgi:hypothetical protein